MMRAKEEADNTVKDVLLETTGNTQQFRVYNKVRLLAKLDYWSTTGISTLVRRSNVSILAVRTERCNKCGANTTIGYGFGRIQQRTPLLWLYETNDIDPVEKKVMFRAFFLAPVGIKL